MLNLAPWLVFVVLLVAQRAIDALAFRHLALPQRCYHRDVILLGVLGRPIAAAIAAGLVLAPLGWTLAAWLGSTPPPPAWASLDPSGWLRVPFLAAIGVVAWSLVGQARNHYYGRWHALDRLAILVSCAACVATPAAAPLALVCSLAFVMQLNYPHGLYHSWTEKRPVYEAVVLLAAAACLGPLVRVEGWMLIAGLGVGLATAYVYPAASKLTLGRPWTWALHNRMEALTVSSAHKGWMWWWTVERVARMVRPLAALRVPMQIATLALELGAIALLLDPDAGVVALVGLVAMHAGIFAASGVAFWKWVILDVALIAALWFAPSEALAPAYALPVIAAGLAAVTLARWCGTVLPLGWIDGPLVGTFVLEATTRAGESRLVAPLTMRPYDLAFGQARFHCLIDEPQIAGAYGILCAPLDAPRIDRLLRQTAGDAEAIARLAHEHGRSRRDDRTAQALERGIAQYFRNRNRLLTRGGWRARLARLPLTPPHLWMGARGRWLRSRDQVDSIEVRWTEIWHADGSVKPIADRHVCSIDVDADQAEGHPRHERAAAPLAPAA
ncbi:MAG: hypothetical protein R3B68_07475 [Phycisphaerales bacterium]